MNDRDPQRLRAEKAEGDHLHNFLERHTDLPLSEVKAMQEGTTVRAEELIAGLIAEAEELATRAFHMAEVIEDEDVSRQIDVARLSLRNGQAYLAARRSDQ